VTAPTALVTGAGRGIGRATVGALLDAGWRVVAGVRDPAVAAELGAGGPDRLLAIALDVADRAAVRAGVAEAERFAGGPLACLVNNAGYGVHGPVEDVDLDAARAMFDTNLFGAAAAIQDVLPGMRRAGRGAIVNVSSIGAHFANPLVGMYHASKHALHGLSEALALECRPFGVRVVMVEPGMVATGFSAALRRTSALTAEGGPYAALAGSLRESFLEWRRRYEVPPEVVAAAIVRAAEDPETPFRLIVGDDAALLARERASRDADDFHEALIDFLAIDLPRRRG
jgi:NAD(P)-dependent dehydrogenase (short-subunit alcohol dehydrogenase family)